MDDLKIYAANRSQLETVLKVIYQLSMDIGMTLGVKKCLTVTMERGKLRQAPAIQLDQTTIIASMAQDPYKYLGILQTNKVEHGRIKEILTNEFQKRLRSILKSMLNSINLVKAINSYAFPVLQYSFGIIKWSHTDLEAINRKIRTELTKFRMHHPRSSVERVTLPREKGGRGIVDAIVACKQQIEGLRRYFLTRTTRLHQAINLADLAYTPLYLGVEEHEPFPAKTTEDKLRDWGSKELHGRFLYDVQKETVDTQSSFEWLRNGTLYPETEGFMISIQDQVMSTRNYRKYIMKENIETDKCRKCDKNQETIEHILSGCQSLAGTKYLERHNKVAVIVYLQIIKMFQIPPETDEPYYKYQPPPVVDSENAKIYWDKGVITDITVAHNRPDIVVVNKKNKTAILIDISVPNNHNMGAKFTEKINKYGDLKREVKEMWGLQEVKIVPVILSSMGLIDTTLKKSIKEIGIPWSTYRTMQKSVVMDATHIVRSFLES